MKWPNHTAVLKSAFEQFGRYVTVHNYSSKLVHDKFEPSEAYRLFMESSAFEPDEHLLTENDQWDGKPTWLARCPDVESLSVILRNLHLEGPVITLQNKFDLLGHVDAWYPLFSGTSDFLQYLGTQASDPRLPTLRHHLHGTSVLFYVAQGLNRSASRGYKSQDWIKLGIEVLKNEPEVLADTGGVLNSTPLSHWLGTFFKKRVYNKLMAFEVLEMIQSWANMIQRAGIDLCQYGAMEAKAWKSMPKPTFSDYNAWESHNYYYQAVVAERLLFGPAPADWTFEVRYIKPGSLKCVLFELQDPPGSFPRDPRVPNKIHWQPTTEEENEGPWVKISEREIPSQPSIFQSATVYLQATEQQFSIIKLLEATQDDTSTIPFLLLRGERTSRTFTHSASRSRSQPPVYRTDLQNYNLHLRRRRIYDWLPCLHLCSSDYKWRFAPCNEGSGTWRSEVDDLGTRRDCIWGKHDIFACAQQSEQWQNNSFIAHIADCQDDYPTMTLRLQCHTGLSDCPQKCRTVNLKNLNVPEELKAYHPRQRQKPDDLED